MAKSQGAFRTISEVATTLDTPTHVLRFWESKFSQIKPVKRAGGRRYYRPEDIQLLAGIKTLLHEQGMTIKGAQKLLREQGVKHVIGLGPDTQAPTETVPAETPAVAVPAPVVDAPAPQEDAPAPQEVAPIEPPAPEPITAQPVTVAVVPDSSENQPSAPAAAPRPRILAQLATTKPDSLRRNAAAIAPHLTQLAQLRDRIRRSQ